MDEGIIGDFVKKIAKFKAVIESVVKEVEENIKKEGFKEGTGYCHILWSHARRILITLFD